MNDHSHASHSPAHIVGGLTGFVSKIGSHIGVHVWPSTNRNWLNERRRSYVNCNNGLPATSIAKQRSSITATRIYFAFSMAKFSSFRLPVSTKLLLLKSPRYLYRILRAGHYFIFCILFFAFSVWGESMHSCTSLRSTRVFFNIIFLFLLIETIRSKTQRAVLAGVLASERERKKTEKTSGKWNGEKGSIIRSPTMKNENRFENCYFR